MKYAQLSLLFLFLCLISVLTNICIKKNNCSHISFEQRHFSEHSFWTQLCVWNKLTNQGLITSSNLIDIQRHPFLTQDRWVVISTRCIWKGNALCLSCSFLELLQADDGDIIKNVHTKWQTDQSHGSNLMHCGIVSSCLSLVKRSRRESENMNT